MPVPFTRCHARPPLNFDATCSDTTRATHRACLDDPDMVQSEPWASSERAQAHVQTQCAAEHVAQANVNNKCDL
eukprot:2599540-Alexandrium_andersonii.AAC.1